MVYIDFTSLLYLPAGQGKARRQDCMTRPATRFVALPNVGGDESKTESSCPVKCQMSRAEGTTTLLEDPSVPRAADKI